MGDLFASLLPVRLNDGTADVNNAVVTNAAPVSGAYALAVRQVGVAAAAALADATGNPTTTGIAAFNLVWNGATWDRLAGAAVGGAQVQGWTAHDGALAAGFPLVVGGRAQATAPTDVSADGDAVRAWLLRNGAQAVAVTAAGALIGGDATNGLDVDVTRLTGGGTASDGALTASPVTIGARASTAVPTAVSADGDVVDLRALRTGALTVHMVDASGNAASVGGGTQYVGDAAATATPTGTMAMGLANAAAPTDVTANADAVAIWALRNGAQVVNLASGGTLITAGQKAMAASIPVVIASDQSALVVDTELSTAAAASDAFANPTAGGVLGFLMGYNGASWDRIRVANTGRLQVDVVSGGGSPAADGIPSGYTAIRLNANTTNTASAATASVVTNTPANTKPFYVKSVLVASAGPTKWQVKFGATVLASGFQSAASGSIPVTFDPPLTGTGDGTTALTVDVTNRDPNATDLYASLRGYVLS